jgi:hypothetical protein
MNTDILQTTAKPFIIPVMGHIEQLDALREQLHDDLGYHFIALADGNKMRKRDTFGYELASACNFPDDWVNSFDFFYDYMYDMIIGDVTCAVLFFTHCQSILAECNDDQKNMFGTLLSEISAYWSQPSDDEENAGHKPLPFHIIMQFDDEESMKKCTAFYHYDINDNNLLFNNGVVNA